MAVLAMAIANLGHEARSFTGSQAGVITDSVARQGADHRRHARPDPTGARRGPHRDRRRVPGRQPGHQGHHHARPRRLGHHRRRAGRRARRRRLRDLHRRRRRLHRRPADRAERPQDRITSATRRCWRWPRRGAKILHLRCVEYARRFDLPIHVRSSFSTARAPGSPTSPDTAQKESPWSSRSSPASRTTAARPRSRSSASRTSPARPPRSSRPSPRAEINIDMIVQNVSAAATGLHRHLVHAAEDRRPDGDGGARARSSSRSGSTRCSTTTRSARCR